MDYRTVLENLDFSSFFLRNRGKVTGEYSLELHGNSVESVVLIQSALGFQIVFHKFRAEKTLKCGHV